MKKDKKNKLNVNKKELIITIVTLVLSVIIGFIAGKALFESFYGKI